MQNQGHPLVQPLPTNTMQEMNELTASSPSLFQHSGCLPSVYAPPHGCAHERSSGRSCVVLLCAEGHMSECHAPRSQCRAWPGAVWQTVWPQSSPSLLLHPRHRAAGLISSMHILCGTASGGHLVLLLHWGWIEHSCDLPDGHLSEFFPNSSVKGVPQLLAAPGSWWPKLKMSLLPWGCYSSLFHNSHSYVEDFALSAFFFCARLSKRFFCLWAGMASSSPSVHWCTQSVSGESLSSSGSTCHLPITAEPMSPVCPSGAP